MILLADGGSTKVDWNLVNNGKLIKQVITTGANPFFRNREEISSDLNTNLKPQLNDFPIEAVYFYGAGCAFPEKNEIVRAAIQDIIDAPVVEVASDLLAAAKGLCGHEKGIACIIGTGSNSCFFDGTKIVDNVSPLGYILGDEGSGAVLGKLFVGACLKNQLTKGLKEKFLEAYNLTPAEIIEKVYRQALPNRFLASFSPFIVNHLDDPTIYSLVYNAFKDFFVKNVMQYDYQNHQTHITGSVSHYYQEVLRKVAEDLEINLGTIAASPMEGLIKYYSAN